MNFIKQILCGNSQRRGSNEKPNKSQQDKIQAYDPYIGGSFQFLQESFGSPYGLTMESLAKQMKSSPHKLSSKHPEEDCQGGANRNS